MNSGCADCSRKESFLPSLEVCAQFVPQRREDWHVTIGLPLGVGDVDLGRIAAEQQILHANMDELVDAGTGLEQRLDHQSVFALDTVGRLNEPLHFVAVQAVYGSIARAGRFERELAPDTLDDIFRLIVAEMMPAPEVKGLLSDEVEGFRFCGLTTRFLLRRVFQSGHGRLKPE
jgi:hypothetical protein